MPVGTGAVTNRLLPAQPFLTDLNAFNQLTKKNIAQLPAFNRAGNGQTWEKTLPQAGIASKVYIVFEGTVTVTNNTGSVDTTNEYPYNLLKELKVAVNGSTDLWHCDGRDLHALQHVRHPSRIDTTDQFPGEIGANVGVASGDLYLRWEVPLAMDDVTLAGALYLQSQSINVSFTGREAAEADLFDVNGDATVTITGQWKLEPVTWEVPYGTGEQADKVVIPDLSRLHFFLAATMPLNNVGRNRLPVPRGDGQLARMFVSAESADGTDLSAHPSTADAAKIDALRVSYGGNKVPFEWDPASFLVAENNDHYGTRVPYDRLVIDQVRTHPIREAILLAGLTELAVDLDVNNAVALNQGRARIVSEILAA